MQSIAAPGNRQRPLPNAAGQEGARLIAVDIRKTRASGSERKGPSLSPSRSRKVYYLDDASVFTAFRGLFKARFSLSSFGIRTSGIGPNGWR